MPDFNLGWIDLTIIIVYLVAMRAIGFWVGRGKETSDDYFLGGRNRARLPCILGGRGNNAHYEERSTTGLNPYFEGARTGYRVSAARCRAAT